MKAEPSLEELRTALSATWDGSSLPASEDLDAIQRAVAGELETEAFCTLSERLAGEPELAAAWQLAVALRDELSPSLEQPSRRRPRGWVQASWVAVALAAGICAGLWLRPPLPTVERAAPHDQIATPLTDRAPLPRQHFLLTWKAPFSAARYDVDVLDGNLALLYRAEGIEDTHVLVPASALATVPPGDEVLWQVEAQTPGGERTLSPTFVQRVE